LAGCSPAIFGSAATADDTYGQGMDGSEMAGIGGERSDRFLDFTLGNPTSDAHGKRIRFLHRQVCGFRRSLVDAQA